jgi:ADP-dependent NAD(P)H-hydrate dehydratase
MKEIRTIPILPPRPQDGHKGTFGKVLIIGGCPGFSGAPALAGKAALRSGSGLVRVAVPRSVQPIVAGLDACYTTLGLPEDSAGQMDASSSTRAAQAAFEHDVVCFGPGAGTGAGAREVLLNLIAQPNLRMVIDADGLNGLALSGNWLAGKKASIILTPHPGEFTRLWKGLSRDPLPKERKEQAAALAEQIGGVVVLKGAGTVVTDSKQIYVNTTGNPGMATAGAGDVLSGIITALAGQGMSDFDAAVAAVFVHGLAGDLAAEEKGQISMTAADLIDDLPAAFRRMNSSRADR